MQKAAAAHGFTIAREDYLSLDREHGTYTYHVRSSADWSKWDGANSGAFKHLELFTSMASGDPIKSWLLWLHMAAVFGLPMQIFVCAMGLIITAGSFTGIIIWWRKRRYCGPSTASSVSEVRWLVVVACNGIAFRR
ncbi:MAG: PepSY domain-containing protein [bacterium]